MKRTARPITAKYLQNAAAFYLERYPSTAEGLRRVLNRRVRKAQMLEAPVMENVGQAIEAIVAKFVDAGVIDDKAFAQTKARVAAPARHIDPAHPPASSSWPASTATRSTRRWPGWTRNSTPIPASANGRAAAALARRRRLGPYRPPEDRKDNRARDLAAMAPRRLRTTTLAKKVIDAATPDALDEV